MIFLVLGITAALLIYVTIITKDKDKGGYPLAFGVLFASVLMFLLIGAIFNGIYYTFGNVNVEYEEIELHSTCKITLEDYIEQEDVTLMDKDHNLFVVDFDKAEITFSAEETKVFNKILTPQNNLMKLFVFQQTREELTVQLYDYSLWIEEFYKQNSDSAN